VLVWFSHARAVGRAVAVVIVAVAGCLCSGAVETASGATLPDGRGWELVSPAQKFGSEVAAESTLSQASASESVGSPAGLTFMSLGGFADAQGTGIAIQYLAERTGAAGTSGWATHAITPRQDPLSFQATVAGLEPGYQAVGDDLNQGLFRSWSPLTGAPNVARVPNLYVRDDLRSAGTGSYQLVTDAPSPLSAPLLPWVADYTPDMQHFLFESPQALTGSTLAGGLYKVDRGVTRLVAAGAVAGQGATARQYTRRVLSRDGRRAIYTLGGHLYQLDDGGTPGQADDTTVQVDTSERTTPDVPGAARYETASVDGSRVFFTSTERLTDDATGESMYVWVRQPTNKVQSLSVSATGGSYRLSFHTHLIHGFGDLTAGSDTVTGIEGPFEVGQAISGTGIPNGATIIASTGDTLTLSATATASTSHESLTGSTASTTGPVAFDASPGQIQSALESLDGIGTGNVAVRAAAGGGMPYSITFEGALAGVAVADLSLDTSGLTGGTATLTTTRDLRNITRIAPFSVVFRGELAASEDGRRLYFASVPGLVGGRPGGQTGVYLWDDTNGRASGTLSVVGGIASEDIGPITDFLRWLFVPKVTRVSNDGRVLVFEAINGTDLTGYSGEGCPTIDNPNDNGNGGCSQVFVYRADTSSPTHPDLVCASCPPAGVRPSDSAYLNIRRGASAAFHTTYLNRALSSDGHYVFFSSPDALVPGDVNGEFDAYEFDVTSGELHLLSSGKDGSGSFFLEATPDGHDAYFVTRERLVGWDTDNAYDVYDARVGGGMPEPVPAAPVCSDDACQGKPSAGPVGAVLGSRFARSFGDRSASPKPPKHRRCKRGSVKRRVRGRARCVRRKRHTPRRHGHRPPAKRNAG
jgi:hypothetical protein